MYIARREQNGPVYGGVKRSNMNISVLRRMETASTMRKSLRREGGCEVSCLLCLWLGCSTSDGCARRV